jgi:hypothetical protein
VSWDLSVIKEMGFGLEGLGSIPDKCENMTEDSSLQAKSPERASDCSLSHTEGVKNSTNFVLTLHEYTNN